MKASCKRRFVAGVLAPVALLVMLVPAVADETEKSTERSSAQQRVPVTVTTVRRMTLEDWRHSVGQLEPFEDPLLSAEVSGRVVKLNVKEGDAVKAGEVVAQLDDADYRLARDMARTDIARVEALLKAAELRMRRISTLVHKGSAPQSALDDATAQRDSLRAQLAGAQVRLQQAERSLAKTRIVSPVGGRVARRMVSVGDLVAPGKPVMRIVASNTMKVRLPYPERELASIRAGQRVRLSTPASPEQHIEAKVTSVSPEIDMASRSAHVLVVMKNVHGWRAGASVDGAVLVGVRKDAFVVPETSVVLRPEGHVVFMLGQDGRVHERKVRLGLRVDGMVEVIDGFAGGERVVVDGAGFLIDGVMVEVKE